MGCYVFGTNFFWTFIIFSGVLCFGDEFFFAVHYFERGVVLGYEFFEGPIGQEAEANTVIISGLAVTAGQFLV